MPTRYGYVFIFKKLHTSYKAVAWPRKSEADNLKLPCQISLALAAGSKDIYQNTSLGTPADYSSDSKRLLITPAGAILP